MCLVLVAWRVAAAYPLVVAANRDEFFSRPTTPAAFWPENGILAGRDGQAGGTWMGVTRSGRFAALTNYRDPSRHRPEGRSRGELVTAALSAAPPPEDFLASLAERAAEYNDFNLLVGDGSSLACLSSVTGTVEVLGPGVHGLSNHLLNTPWPKVATARPALTAALAGLPDLRPLFHLLRDDGIHPDAILPRTGVGLEWERLLSSAFVRAGDYGTRSSTVLLRGEDDSLIFDEQTWLADARPGGRARYRFMLKGSAA